MRRFKVSKEMTPYLERVFRRDGIKYLLEFGSENYFSVELSGNKFHVFMEDALCEKEFDEIGLGIPVVSHRTFLNKKKLDRLLKLAGRKSFFILKKDERRFLSDPEN